MESQESNYQYEALEPVFNTTNYVFVGADEASRLFDMVDRLRGGNNWVTVEVVIFPIRDGEAVSKNPRRGYFAGELTGVLMNDSKTKGHFTFSNGQTIYRDKNILE